MAIGQKELRAGVTELTYIVRYHLRSAWHALKMLEDCHCRLEMNLTEEEERELWTVQTADDSKGRSKGSNASKLKWKSSGTNFKQPMTKWSQPTNMPAKPRKKQLMRNGGGKMRGL